MASFKKLPNGTWQATISCGRDINGKQIRKYVTKPTLKECKAAAREIEMEIEENKLLAVSNMRFSSWSDKWLEIKKPLVSPSTFLSYKMYIDKHFNPYFGRFKLEQINELHIRQYISKKLDEKLSSETIRKHFFVLNDILDTALKEKNPAKNIEPPKRIEFTPQLPTEDEFKKIHESLKGAWDEIPFLLAAWCGMRQGEIFALKWDDIDWEGKTVVIDENKAISTEGYILKSPKSNKGKRKIVIPEYILNLLKAYRKNELQNKTQEDELSNTLIFNMRPDSYSKRWGKIMERLELPHIRFHDLRHYHASILYKAGIPDHYAAQRLGHDIMVLKKIYQHLQLEDKEELDKKVVNLFQKQKPGN